MSQAALKLLREPAVQAGMIQARIDSQPGPSGGHEEGGFVIRHGSGTIEIVRWPRGEGDAIDIPPHANCVWNGCEILATFHTHPNTGPDYLQEPGKADRVVVRDDPDLKESHYLGEYVIADRDVYLIQAGGDAYELGLRSKLLTTRQEDS